MLSLMLGYTPITMYPLGPCTSSLIGRGRVVMVVSYSTASSVLYIRLTAPQIAILGQYGLGNTLCTRPLLG